MLSILFRDTARCLRNKTIFKFNFPTICAYFDYSSFTVNDFKYNSSDETGTLLTRFVKYLAMENSKFVPLVPTTIKYADFFPVVEVEDFRWELRTTDVTQIPHLIIFAFTYKSNGDPQQFVKILNEVDKFCEANLAQMDYDTILHTLYAFMFLLPNKITKTNFYNKAMERLVQDFRKNYPKENFVKACFYLGLGKKNSSTGKLLHQLHQSFLQQHLPELSTMDISIIGNAAYKSSVLINNQEFMDKIVSEVIQMNTVTDDALLVNLVKILRHNRAKSEEICVKLDTLCDKKTLGNFQMAGIIHLFTYFAECLWNNEGTCSRFVKEGMYRIRDSNEYIRGKDLSTFLWCCAQLQLNNLLEQDDLRSIERLMLKKIAMEEYKYFPDQLIDGALSFWMLGYYSRGIIEEITGLRNNQNKKKTNRAKLDTRHNVLLSSVAIEKPDWLAKGKIDPFVEDFTAPDFLVKNRPGLNEAVEKLKAARVKAKIVAPINGINFAGILVGAPKEQKMYVEVLEDEHILKFEKKPIAIVQLKIRLLKHLGYNVMTIRTSELGKLNLQEALALIVEPQVEAKNEAAV